MLFVKGEVLPTQNSGVYGDQPAIVVSDFNYVGNASALIKKGANESFNDVNDFRDIFVEAFKPIKKSRLILILERAVNVRIFDSFGPLIICIFAGQSN